MLEHQHTPPPFHDSSSPSDQSLPSSRDTTPITPGAAGFFPESKRPDFGKESSLSRFKRPTLLGSNTTSLGVDSATLLRPDFDDHSFPLFDTAPKHHRMAIVASPHDLPTRQTSTSPRGNQPSHLTAALKKNGSGELTNIGGMTMDTPRPIPVSSDSDMSRFENGARPISVKGKPNEKNRRESLAQSLGMGMSWGGVSVGSWVRDDMMMAGTSPFAFHQSPSYHSSSYLPKLEANFMKDFACCGLTLPTLHDLLQHYEEAHAQKEGMPGEAAEQPVIPDQRAAIATNTAAQVQHEAQRRAQNEQPPIHAFQSSSHVRPGLNSSLQTIPDMDTVEDMEMDDIDTTNESTPPSNAYAHTSNQASPSMQFASTIQPQVPQLNTNLMQSHQAYRNSTPNTPIAGRNSVAIQGANISSTLNPNPMQQFQDLQNPYRGTPDSSAPGTPGELDESLMAGMDDMSMSNNMFGNQNGFGGFGFGMNSDMIDLCIDEPAKRLFSPTGQEQGGNQQAIHQRLGSGQYGANSDIARRIREQQMAAGLPDTNSNLAPHEEPKPFRCPVIGCEKAYKNQNGLKYHKTHGHQNQRLHENGDGTFSIVDPDTQAPYPGTMGMEKEKPYKCDVCQKRYKNLNGLKYHKTHSPPCNPELQQQKLQQQAGHSSQPQSPLSGMMSGQNLNMNMGYGFGMNDEASMSRGAS